MARIVTDVQLEAHLETCKLNGFDVEAVTAKLKRLEFQQFINRLPYIEAALKGAAPPAKPAKEAAPAYEDPDLAFFSAEETDQAQAVKAVDIAPQVITTEEALYELLDLLGEQTDPAQPVAWDTETTSLTPRDADLVGIGCCWGDRKTDLAYIPLGHKDGTQLDKATVLEALRPILEGAEFPKVLQNAKYDRLVLRSQGIHLAGVVFDTMLASYVLNPDSNHNLSDLSLKYLNVSALSYSP